MDQSTSNGSDKRNWRERLGIGTTKDLPRISEEFKPKKEPAMAASRAAEGTAVAKPAPMAPRVTAKAALAPKPAAPPLPRQESSSSASGTEMADRLKAQRVAAEKLAEQRVHAARERAEAARNGDAKPVVPPVKAPPAISTPMPSLAVSKPKFSFADEDQAPAPRDFSTSFTQRPAQPSVPTQLSPPRPALGGDRTVPPAVRSPSQPAPSFQPQYRPPQPPPGFRPVETASNMPAPPRINPRAYGETPYTPPAQDRPVPARPAYEPSYRQDSDPADSQRADYRPARQRPRPAVRPQTNQEDDYGDVFEDDAPRAARRASAREYNQAYRDVEEGYEDEGRRSAAPWVILGLFLLAAIAAAAVLYYYQNNWKSAAPTAASGEVPVVAAPEQPAKTAAESPVEPAAGGAEVPANNTKKQIYDRIVGDREVLGGEMVPTEETPVPPPVQPEQGNTNAAPADGGAQQPAAGDDTVPLPLPPPPGDGDASQSNTQGTLSPPVPAATNNATVEAASALPEPPTQAEAVPAAGETAEAKAAETLEIRDGEKAAKPEQAEAAPPPKPAKKVAARSKAKVKAKPKAAPEQDVSTAEPLVLVPPAGGEPVANAPQAGEAVTPAPKKKRTLADLFRRNRSNTDEPAQQQVAGVDADQQVGSLPAPAPAKPRAVAPAKPRAAAPAPAGGGFVAQLASFRTEAEATREWSRVKSKHSGIVGGLPPRISQATVAGSTRYRLGVGPMADKSQASQLCDQLLAAGERDCIVRAQ